MGIEGKSPEEISALAALSDSLLNDPKFAGPYKRMLKAQNPQLSMPEVELEDKVATSLRSTNERITKMEQERAQREATSAAEGLMNRLIGGGHVKDGADFQELVKYASENGYSTSELGLRRAAENRSYEKEAAEPTPVSVIGRGSILPHGSADFLKDANGTARSVAQQAMDAIIQSRRTGKALPA